MIYSWKPLKCCKKYMKLVTHDYSTPYDCFTFQCQKCGKIKMETTRARWDDEP